MKKQIKKEQSMIVMKFTEKEQEVIQEFKDRFGEAFSGNDKALAQFIIAKMSATKDNVLEFIYELMNLLQKEANDQAGEGSGKATARLMGYSFDALRGAISDNLHTPLQVFADLPLNNSDEQAK